MIDIHTHILPNVDDGSNSLATSLAMLQKSETAGVTDIVLTPHLRFFYNKTPAELKDAYEHFVAFAKSHDVNVNLFLGQEIFVDRHWKKLFASDGFLKMANSNCILLEFDYFDPIDISEIVYELITRGFKPIIAHVERYRYLTFDDICDIKSIGGLIQVNASSVVGEEARKFKKLMKSLFKNGLVDFIASDIHDKRKYLLSEAYEFVSKKFGKETAATVFEINAKEYLGI